MDDKSKNGGDDKVADKQFSPVTNSEQDLNIAVTSANDNAETVGSSMAAEAQPTQPAVTSLNDKTTTTKSKWFMPAILAGVLILGGGAAAYLTVFQKSPEQLWKSALNNTADGLDSYLTTSMNSEQKGFSSEGSFKLSSPIAIDGEFEGNWYETNGNMSASFGAGGARITSEVRTIAAENSSNPDIYLKIDGLDGVDELLSSFTGAEGSEISNSLAAINDQWFFIDHTLLDQYTAAAGSSDSQAMTEEDLKEVTDKMMLVMRDRMFSVSEDKAIFKIAEKIGKEDFEGTSTYKMRVEVDQTNFKNFVVALKDAAKDTKLEELLKMGQPDQTLEDALSFDNLIEELEKADFSKATADVWVEGNGGYVRNVRFYPIEDEKDSNYLDFGMNYTGGDVFPLYIRATMDDNGTKGRLTFGFEPNKTNGDIAMTMNIDISSDSAPIKAEGRLSVKGSNEQVNVEKPTEAQNIFELLGGLTNGLDTSYDDSLDLTVPTNFDLDDFPIDDVELQ